MTDNVNYPAHYEKHAVTIQTIQLIETAGFLWGNVLKYCIRYKDKGQPLEDLKKARWYVQRIMDYEKADAERAEDNVIDVEERADLQKPDQWLVGLFSKQEPICAAMIDYVEKGYTSVTEAALDWIQKAIREIENN